MNSLVHVTVTIM